MHYILEYKALHSPSPKLIDFNLLLLFKYFIASHILLKDFACPLSLTQIGCPQTFASSSSHLVQTLGDFINQRRLLHLPLPLLSLTVMGKEKSDI